MIAAEYSYFPQRFSHASAACEYDSGVLVSFYSGATECHETQKVHLYYLKDGQHTEPLILEEYTGNPILFNHNGKPYVIYTKFEKFTAKNRALWWQGCSLWQREIILKKNSISVGRPHRIIIDEDKDNPEPGIGYVPRCHPIYVNDKWYLPLYREQEPHFYGVIMESDDGLNWVHQGNIGKSQVRCIQPTIWYSDGSLHALLRNFNFGISNRKAYYSRTDKNGEWTKPISSILHNANNSLVVLKSKDVKHPILIWNNDPTGRRNISLSLTMGKNAGSLVLDNYGSYPTLCETKDNIHVLYSTKPRALISSAALIIKHLILDKNQLNKLLW